MEDAITAIVKYLVAKRLTGDLITLLTVKEYLVDGLSPSTIGYKYKISKYRVRGYIQRVVDKAGSHVLATNVVKAVFNHILNLDPIVFKVGGRYVCLACDATLRASELEYHIRRKHRDLVARITHQIVNKVKKEAR